MTTLRGLLDRINRTYTHPPQASSQPRPQPVRPEKCSTEQSRSQLKEEIKNMGRPHWKMGKKAVHPLENQLLKHRQLSNWEISRISLSQRSYRQPRNDKSIKESSAKKGGDHLKSRENPRSLPSIGEKRSKDGAESSKKADTFDAQFVPTNRASDRYFGFVDATKGRQKNWLKKLEKKGVRSEERSGRGCGEGS